MFFFLNHILYTFLYSIDTRFRVNLMLCGYRWIRDVNFGLFCHNSVGIRYCKTTNDTVWSLKSLSPYFLAKNVALKKCIMTLKHFTCKRVYYCTSTEYNDMTLVYTKIKKNSTYLFPLKGSCTVHTHDSYENLKLGLILSPRTSRVGVQIWALIHTCC